MNDGVPFAIIEIGEEQVLDELLTHHEDTRKLIEAADFDSGRKACSDLVKVISHKREASAAFSNK